MLLLSTAAQHIKARFAHGMALRMASNCLCSYALCPHDRPVEHASLQVHGRYVANNKVTKPAKAAQDDAVARRLWDVSCELTHVVPVC